MIVVAIIGILAAVAVPGFMRYIKDSKTAEAKDNLKSITDGAISWFESEHNYDKTGMHPQSRLYPSGTEVGTLDAALTSTTAGAFPLGDNSVIGQKNAPDYMDTVTALSKAPWTQLKYQINKPFYYKYTYSVNAAAPGASKFGVSAVASLSELQDSGFIINGDNGVVGNIIDCADGKTAATSTDGVAACAT